MTLKTISIRNLLRRKGKAGFVLAGLVVGVSTVVGILSFVEAMTSDINHKLEQYGANILIVPRTENLALSYGGLTLGGVSFEMQEISPPWARWSLGWSMSAPIKLSWPVWILRPPEY